MHGIMRVAEPSVPNELFFCFVLTRHCITTVARLIIEVIVLLLVVVESPRILMICSFLVLAVAGMNIIVVRLSRWRNVIRGRISCGIATMFRSMTVAGPRMRLNVIRSRLPWYSDVIICWVGLFEIPIWPTAWWSIVCFEPMTIIVMGGRNVLFFLTVVLAQISPTTVLLVRHDAN
jgi:hypothetical protein